jgi:hypothetical protein
MLASCAREEGDELWNELRRRLLHEPVASALHHDPADVGRHETPLLDEEVSGGLSPVTSAAGVSP